MATNADRAALDTLLRTVQQESKAWAPARRGDRLDAALARAVAANDSGTDVDGALEELRTAWEQATDPHGDLSRTPPLPEE